MSLRFVFATVCVLGLPCASADLLQQVSERGYLKCAVEAGHEGFASPDVYGEWKGFDADFCRAIAAAVLGDGELVMFVSADRSIGIDSLATGSADVVARAATDLSTLGGEGARSVGVLLHDSYGFLTGLSVKDLSALDDASVCIAQAGGAAEVIKPYLKSNHPRLQVIDSPALSLARERYQSGRCAAVAGLRSDLAGIRARLPDADEHHLLEVELGKAPAGPRVRGGDDRWAKVVQWVLYALIDAEELGVASTNVAQHKATPASARVRDLLGAGGEPGAGFGLGKEWAYEIIRQVGNYAEIYDRNIGPGTPLDLPRTRSRLWDRGGMLFAPPATAR